VLRLTGKAGKLLERSIGETRSLTKELRAKARGRGAQAKLAAAKHLEELAARCEKVADQVRKRVKGEPIADRIVSLSDPDARPIRKGKRGKPTEFGYVSQIAEVTASTKPGQRGFVLPPSTAPGNPHENELLPQTVAELQAVGMSPREVALDGGFGHRKTDEQLAPIAPERTFVAGRPSDRSKCTSAASPATGSEQKDEYRTSNVATASTDHASKEAKATRPGPDGRPSPTTSTPTSPSAEQKGSEWRSAAAGARRGDRGPPPSRAPFPSTTALRVFPGRVSRPYVPVNVGPGQ